MPESLTEVVFGLVGVNVRSAAVGIVRSIVVIGMVGSLVVIVIVRFVVVIVIVRSIVVIVIVRFVVVIVIVRFVVVIVIVRFVVVIVIVGSVVVIIIVGSIVVIVIGSAIAAIVGFITMPAAVTTRLIVAVMRLDTTHCNVFDRAADSMESFEFVARRIMYRLKRTAIFDASHCDGARVVNPNRFIMGRRSNTPNTQSRIARLAFAPCHHSDFCFETI